MRAERERVFSALCHLFNAVPLWGMLFCGWIWFTLREESRAVVYHARQAMTFHVLLMLTLLIYIALEFIARVLGVLSSRLGMVLHQLNGAILEVAVIGYVAICLYGCVQCALGQPFHYPLLGQRTGS